ncbi:hypothetical protein ACFYSF_35780 [Streptomyces canus]|uniref:hypothetical protein n=1 Tax=Streptomyces canus TaxID=58343 RepID=UPI0036955F4B
MLTGPNGRVGRGLGGGRGWTRRSRWAFGGRRRTGLLGLAEVLTLTGDSYRTRRRRELLGKDNGAGRQ